MNNKERFLRAASFFSGAYTQPVLELSPFDPTLTLSDEAKKKSVMAVEELHEFFKPEPEAEEWDFEEAYAKVMTQRQWASKDQKWADKILKACHALRFLRSSRFRNSQENE
jgi:hypothetical protein